MKTKEPIPDPETIALAKVYALLIRVARQHKMTSTQADAKAEMESVLVGNAVEAPQSRNLAKVALSITE